MVNRAYLPIWYSVMTHVHDAFLKDTCAQLGDCLTYCIKYIDIIFHCKGV